MSDYISLNPHTQLEQVIAYDLQTALEKRGFSVFHNGASNSHAPGGKPDIVVFNKDYVLIVEVTKSKSAAQDREFQSIRSHLKKVKVENPEKQCFCVFVSPKTSNRTFDSIYDHNQQRDSEGKKDMKIIPLSFNSFEVWVTRLIENAGDQYPVMDFIKIAEQHNKFIDDFSVFKILAHSVFPTDTELFGVIKQLELEQDNKKPESLARDLILFEDYVRKHGISESNDETVLHAWFALFTNRYMRSFHSVSKATGLSRAQYDFLTELYHEGECTISHISERFDISNAAASQLVEKLVHAGYLERAEDPSDRRAKLLKLSPSGAKLVDEGINERYRWMDELTKNLSAEERAKVAEALNILIDAARKVDT